MTSVPFVADAVIELASRFSGQLLQPADAGYEEARKVHNGLVNKRPVLIARCRGVADVVDAVNLARKLTLEVAVRGGGHNVAGRATVDNGLMIDLAPMPWLPSSSCRNANGFSPPGSLRRESTSCSATMPGCQRSIRSTTRARSKRGLRPTAP